MHLAVAPLLSSPVPVQLPASHTSLQITCRDAAPSQLAERSHILL
jgi:hypothetical protein